jgi:Flp pilus assembly protein TadD
MPSLSIVMITKNEAATLPTCLETVAPIADDIVVVDTGSTDRTPVIAEDFGARVFTFPWADDFAAARNFSLAQAKADWLLHMDADEALDPDNAALVRALVDQDGAGADAVEVTLANYCDDPRAWRFVPVPPGDPWARGRSGYVRTRLLRLFRNHRGYHYREPVHENITASVLEAGGRIASSDILIHHYGYAPDPERRQQKARAYYTIARAKHAAAPDDLKNLLDLAEHAFACGEAAEAEAACRHALTRDPAHFPCGMLLANLLLNRGELAPAQALLLRLRDAGNDTPHLHTALGAIAVTQGRTADAKRHLEHALALEPRAALPLLYLARALDREGRTDHARRELELARDLCPNLPEFADRLRAHELRTEGEAFLRAGHTTPALEALVAALKRDPEDPLTHNALGVALHALGDLPRARESFQRALTLSHALPEAAENLAAVATS